MYFKASLSKLGKAHHALKPLLLWFWLGPVQMGTASKKEGSDHLFPDDRCRWLPPDKGKLLNCMRSNPVKMKPSEGLECFVCHSEETKIPPLHKPACLDLHV